MHGMWMQHALAHCSHTDGSCVNMALYCTTQPLRAFAAAYKSCFNVGTVTGCSKALIAEHKAKFLAATAAIRQCLTTYKNGVESGTEASTDPGARRPSGMLAHTLAHPHPTHPTHPAHPGTPTGTPTSRLRAFHFRPSTVLLCAVRTYTRSRVSHSLSLSSKTEPRLALFDAWRAWKCRS